MDKIETPARDIPPGFVHLPLIDGFVGANGPLYIKREGDQVILGFRVEQRHCNPMDICHGGMISTFADMQLPLGSRLQADLPDNFLPTISLNTDFLGPAPLGAWVEGRTQVLRRTRNLVFAQALVYADGAIVARSSGTFKIGPAMEGVAGKLFELLGDGTPPGSDAQPDSPQ
ncbi:PaaI family thioesterase [Zavarzinia sp. CC-PAN008]|uniref:PaaI family thioesterase n=1 Tax=Zavarzinia sp. CC-PAN008 TaxID=3243332 RepID=UPI003F749EE3